MIARADGVFAYNKDTLEYPDNYQTDIKQLLNTFNDDLKAELQEGRINIHLASATTPIPTLLST